MPSPGRPPLPPYLGFLLLHSWFHSFLCSSAEVSGAHTSWLPKTESLKVEERRQEWWRVRNKEKERERERRLKEKEKGEMVNEVNLSESFCLQIIVQVKLMRQRKSKHVHIESHSSLSISTTSIILPSIMQMYFIILLLSRGFVIWVTQSVLFREANLLLKWYRL